MKKLLTIMLLLPLSAFATNRGDHETSGNPTQNANLNAFQSTKVESTANSSSFSGAMATGGAAYSNAQGGRGGSATVNNQVSGGDGGFAVNEGNSVQFNQVQQTPFAYAPGLAQSFSQDNCANTASVGVSAGFGAISGGAPVESDSCNRRKDVTLWLVTGQNRIACERMTDDDANMDAMKRAGMDCKTLTEIKPPVNVPVNRDLTVYDKMDYVADKQIQFINKKLGK
jgi:hypothetical protein